MTSSTSSSERSLAAVLVAVVAPLLVLGAGLAWLWRPETHTLSEEAAKMDERMAEAQPQVVILGNSLAYEGIDGQKLGQALGNRSALHMTVFASPPPTWYAVLKNRVAAHDHKPELVVVVGTLGFFVQTDLQTSMQIDGLARQVGPDEPVIAAKTYGRAAGHVPGRVRLRTSGLRDAFVDAGRLSLFRLRGMDRAQAEAQAAAASEQVFEAEDAVDFSLNKRVIPVVEVERQHKESDEVDLDQTYIPDLIAQARELGSQIVFVRAPMPPSTMARAPNRPALERALVAYLNEAGAGWIDLTDLGLPETSFRDSSHVNSRGREVFTAKLIERLGQLGALQAEALAPSALPLVTEEVVREGTVPPLPALDLASAKALGGCRFEVPAPELAFLGAGSIAQRRLEGAEPQQLLWEGRPLTRVGGKGGLGEGCTGSFFHDSKRLLVSPPSQVDGLVGQDLRMVLDPEPTIVSKGGNRRWHWLYGGTSLVFRFAEGQAADEAALVVQAELDVLDPGAIPAQGEAAWLVVHGADGQELGRAAFAPAPDAAPGQLAAELSLPPVTTAFQVALVGDGALPVSYVAGLGVGATAERLRWLVGADSESVSVRVLGGQAFAPEFSGEVPRIVRKAAVEATKKEGIGQVWLPGLKPLSNTGIAKISGKHRCSPLVLTEDGVPMEGRHARCKDLQSGKSGPGSYCHEGKKILLRASDGSQAGANSHAYDVVLDPEQRCKSAWWLYPGQKMVRQVKKKDLRPLRVGADTLVLSAYAFPREGKEVEDGPLRLTFSVGGEKLIERTLAISELGAEPLRMPLSTPISRASADVELTIKAAKDSPLVLVTFAVLEHSEEDEEGEAGDTGEQEQGEEDGDTGGK